MNTDLMLAQLKGANRGFIFTSKRDVIRAANILMGCGEHFGEHHFGVVGEGRGIIMSSTGVQCLVDHGMLLEAIAMEEL